MGLFGKTEENEKRAELSEAREETRAQEHVTLSEEEAQMLAYMHVHNAPMPQITRALMLSESAVLALLETPMLKELTQVFEQEIQANAKTADELYDAVEITAMTEVHSLLATGQIMDIKTLMSAANMANRADRKSNRLALQKGNGQNGGGTPEGTARLEQRPVIRLRSRFVKRIQTQGTEEIMEREAEIIVEGQRPENRLDHMTPDRVQNLVEESLGVDMTQAQQRHTFGDTVHEPVSHEASAEDEFNERLEENLRKTQGGNI